MCYNVTMKKKTIGYLIALGLIALDLISKSLITSNISLGERLPIIDGFFWLTNVRNTGAAWSIFQDHTWILTMVSWVVSIGLLIYYQRQELKGIPYVCLVMIIAGALGNGIDRLFFSYVRDFLSFNIFGYMFPVFNLADSLLTIGCLIFLIHTLVTPEATHE